MLDVLKSPTTASGELCVVTFLTTETHKSPAICSDFGTFYILLTLVNLLHVVNVAMKTKQTGNILYAD